MELFIQYVPYIASLPNRDHLSKDDLLVSLFLLHKETGLEIYYAPFDYVNENAKVVLIGITPGWTQMEMAFRFAKKGLEQGMPLSKISAYTKQQASFAGLMRKNLIDMLDGLELPKYLGIASSASLFNKHQNLLHTTSAIRYPVFVNGRNYTGYKPNLLKTPILRQYVYEFIASELQLISQALLIPLGKSVSAALRLLIDDGLLDSKHCLLDFPHPSGANGHRVRQYIQMQSNFKKIIQSWSESQED